MLRGDERAQSIQVGAVLLFAALIIALSTYQAFVVPQQNEEVEFTHNQAVQNQLADLRNALVSVPGDSTTQSVSVTLGTNYPGRLVALNPGPPSGSLRTAGTTDPAVNVSVTNARATPSENADVGDVWNGTPRNYSTGAIAYRPNYNVYGGAPTTYYENSVLFNEFDDGEVALTDQTLVEGNTISLVALNGSLSRTSSGSTSVDVEPMSASTTTVTVRNRSQTEPLTVRVPTRLSESTWEEDLLADEMGAAGHVADVYPVATLDSSGLQLMAIEMEPNTDYDLRMAKAGVGSDTSGEERAYLTDVSGAGATVPADGRADVVVEVRDRFNNPVGGVPVQASTNDSAGTLTDADRTTGSDGRATFTVRGSTSTPTPVSVNLSFGANPAVAGANFNATTAENATLTVYAGQSGGGNGSSGPGYVVDWRDFSVVPGPGVTDCEIPCRKSFEAVAIANPPDPGKVVTYYSNNTSAAALSPTYGATNISGQHTTAITVRGETDAVLSASNTTGADEVVLDTVFESTFEGGMGVWRPSGTFLGAEPSPTSTASNRGQQSVAIRGGDPGGIVTQPIYDTSEAELVTVEYWARADGPGADEDLVLEYIPQGGDPNVDGDWVEIDRLENDATGGTTFERRARIAADDAAHLSFKLRFRQVGANATDDVWYVDDAILRTYGPTATAGGGGGDQPPTADAGPNRAVDEGNTIELDGTGSTDDGSIDSYSWQITSGPGTLSDAATATPDYSAPADVDGDQFVTVELTVTDDAEQTDTDTTQVTVEDTSSPPSVAVQAPNGGEQLAGGSTYTVEWTASDPDDDLDSFEIDYSPDDGTTWESVTTVGASERTYDWTVPTDNTTIAVIRVTATDAAGNIDSDTSDDTFTVDSDPPGVSTASLPGTPINDSEANANVERTLTVTFDEAMDQSVAPTFSFTNVGSDSVSQVDGTGGWVDSTTYEVDLQFDDDNVDETVEVRAADARDAAGNQMTEETALSFVIDTQSPDGVNGVAVVPDYINASNQNAVDVTTVNPDPLDGDETMEITLTDQNGNTVTARQEIASGAGGRTNFTVDASSLDDGPVAVTAVAEDDVGNTGGVAEGDNVTKDTVAPTVSDYNVTGSGSDEITVTFNVTEEETDVDAVDVSISIDGPGQVEELIDSNNSTSGNTKSVDVTYRVSQPGEYDVSLASVVDLAGNDGASGQTKTVQVSSPLPTISTRIDDLSDDTEDRVRLISSYNISNTNSSFERVDISIDAQWQSGPFTQSATKAGVEFTNGYGTENSYQITFDVVYTINGDERVVVSETVSDIPDGSNPSGNADLAGSESAQFTAANIEDRSTTSGGPRYRFDYEVGGGSFSEVAIGLLNVNDNGETEVRTGLSRNDDQFIAPGGGGIDTEYRPVIVVRDANGAVVDTYELIDTADGTTAGNNRDEIQAQVNNFKRNPGQDTFSVQAQGSDNGATRNMDRLEYVVFDSSGNVVATRTETGTGQEIQPGEVTIQSDVDVEGSESYTVIVTGYDEDGNYDWGSRIK